MGCGSSSPAPSEKSSGTAQAFTLAPLDCIPPGDSWPSFGRDLCNTRSVEGSAPSTR
jgi:hypothetical protein